MSWRSARCARNVQTRNCIDVGGVWIDDGFNAKMETVTVKAMSKAYFRMLELQPKMRDVFQLGNHVVWVTPSGRALVIDGQRFRRDERRRYQPAIRSERATQDMTISR